MRAGVVPPGTAENIPGHPSWVHSTENRNRGRKHVSSWGNGGLWVVARTRKPHMNIPGLTSWDILSRPWRDCSCFHVHPGLTSWATLSRPCGTQVKEASSHAEL